MFLQKSKSDPAWGCKLPNLILLLYFIFCLPITRLGLGANHWGAQHALELFIIATLSYLTLINKIPLKNLGLSNNYLKQNLLLGGACATVILLTLPMLDYWVEISVLANTELFSKKDLLPRNSSLTNLGVALFFIPLRSLLDQLFFSGFIIQTYLKRYNPYLVIYLGGLVFAAAHASFSLSSFLIGLFTAYLFFLTGTVAASIIFEWGCLTAGVLLTQYYSRLATLLFFFY